MNPEHVHDGATPDERAQWALTWCQYTASRGLLYAKGGGHAVEAVKPWGIPPTVGEDPNGPIGYDCSGAACGALWYAGVLGQQTAMSTDEEGSTGHGLEGWGVEGNGPLTIRVLDIPEVIHHAFVVLTVDGQTHYFAAQLPGVVVDFFHPGPEWVASFHSRIPQEDG
jgi:hypothetical protein